MRSLAQPGVVLRRPMQVPSWCRIGTTIASLLLVAVGTLLSEQSHTRHDRRPVEHLYSDGSPFNQKIAATAALDPRSSRMIRSLVAAGNKQGFLIALKRWTVPIYYADGDTRRYNVRMTARWAPARVFKRVPIPAGAAPDPAGDGHMVIIDRDSGCEFDFWQAKRKKKGRWRASWGNSLRTDGDGVFPKGLSARGSGFALPAGMIWPDELRSGSIDHALQFSYNYPKKGGPVSPATKSDGRSSRRNAIPEGARLRLDPNLDLDALHLEPYERVIAETLQEYGMFLADIGGGVELQAVHPMSFEENPYEGLLPDRRYVYLNKIPLARFQVLKIPPQQRPEEAIVASGCGALVPKTSGGA